MTFDAREKEWAPLLPAKFRDGRVKSMAPRLEETLMHYQTARRKSYARAIGIEYGNDTFEDDSSPGPDASEKGPVPF